MVEEIEIIEWLLNGDVSIKYQIHRDVLCSIEDEQKKLQAKIETEGWGAQFLCAQQENGHWGRGFYQPKWTSTHYTLLDLKNIGLSRNNRNAQKSILKIFDEAIGRDGGGT